MNTNTIINGDALTELNKLPDEFVDLIVTDPPYGYSFMNKDWDKAVVSVDIWKECLRVLKSGAFVFVMSAPRQDVLSRMIVNLQDAGFRTDFTSIYWTYSSGFPKAANISKLIDKKLGVEREQAKKLDGSYAGFQPKPAVEVILVVMKPLSENTFVDQALNNAKGITWLDDCRIPFQNNEDYNSAKFGIQTDIKNNNYGTNRPSNGHVYNKDVEANPKGRFPANLLVDDDSLNDGQIWKGGSNQSQAMSIFGNKMKERKQIKRTSDEGSYSRYFDLNAWYSGQFIITPKASPSERNKGLENEPLKDSGSTNFASKGFGELDGHKHLPVKAQNHHPTVKPLKLMSYIITMGSREHDIVLDPFCGSGTTLIAAHQLNRKWIGIDNNIEYVEIARKRIEPYLHQSKLFIEKGESNV